MSDTTDLSRQLGAALGEGYAVERPLGEGGFAVVFLVRDLALKRNLAVKVLSPEMITSKIVLERFKREAETVAQLSHPNVVPLYFIGEKENLLYLAMQCVEGGSIADRLKHEGRMSVEYAVRVTCEVASALAHAHKRGVIHRDIKPANILIDPESGRSLVTDFGIARTADATTLTATGMMVGTPAYLSPEQVTGDVTDHRVDIFALGVMLYEMLAGRIPYDAPTPGAAMMMRLGGPPDSITTVRPEVPEQVAAVITGCLAADPEDRFHSAAEVIGALEGKIVTTGGRATRNVPIPRRPRTALRIGVGAVAVSLLSGAAWWTMRERPAPRNSELLANAPRVADSNMVSVVAGDYVIGSDAGPALARPRHTEHVGAFHIERTEVTVGDYGKFVVATHALEPWIGAKPDTRFPVTRVPWGDAANYCAWKFPGGRLPTELEWEAAARGLAAREYPYGNLAEVARANTASARRTGVTPVGSFPRSTTADGLQDMSGNVWEWTSSPMQAYPGAPAMSESLSHYRVIRGGAFDTNDSLATGWMRGYLKESALPAELPNTGFRCASG